MAFHQTIIFLLAFAVVHLSRSQVLTGSVSCLDCDPQYDYSGIVVMMRCKKVSVTKTSKNGTFMITLPTDMSTSLPSSNCVAKILSSKEQLYIEKANMVTKVKTATSESDSSGYTISNPLSFFTLCPFSKDECQVKKSARTKWSKSIHRLLSDDDYGPKPPTYGSSPDPPIPNTRP